MDEKFLSPYNPKETEDSIYERWEESGFFNPDICVEKGITKKGAESYSIVLPPPNVTGVLHMGHAAMLAIQDILIRFNRMCGKKTLWLPGTDHAAIATQSRVEGIIYKTEKKNRHDLGREEFLKRVEDFAQESRDTIVNQIRKMGSSVDWTREAYTLDEKRSHAVRTAFKRMYDEGLIYRGNRIVNWDPKGQTTVSDDEVNHEERKATLYTFKYSKDFPILISTTRPETKLGDTGVAVHPEDPRYQEYVGKTFTVPFMGTTLSITVVADESVDIEFGTGAVGVTPAHSHTDWEIAQRHNLPLVQVINEYAKMTVGDEGIIDTKTTVAREVIVERLRAEGLLEKEEETTQNVSVAERTNGVIEPLPKLQWWVDTDKEFVLKDSKLNGIPSGSTTTLKKILRTVVEQGQIDIIPGRFVKTYYHWIDNLRPWCISRQIWFGHRIPVWYRSTDAHGRQNGTPSDNRGVEMYVGVEAPKGDGWEQDSDTLDTWFSSGLWTFSTLGWPFDYAQGKPKKGSDLDVYHPTTVLETGYDILFFWVARMILMSGYHLGDVPFKSVYLHGLVRDAKGQKMSKSIGNTIDPLEMIEKYGGDATRLSLIIGATPGNDLRLSEDKIRGYKHFANKIWNITRFVLTSVAEVDLAQKPSLTPEDIKRLEELHKVVATVTEHIEKFRLDIAADTVYHYVWHTFADTIIEECKAVIQGENMVAKASTQWTLYTILTTSLKLLHPFMPFVTEAIWTSIPHKDQELLMVEKWPTVQL